LIRDAGADRFGHLVVDFEDDSLGSVFAVRGLVLLPDDGERVEDVGPFVAVDALEVGVKLEAEQEAAEMPLRELLRRTWSTIGMMYARLFPEPVPVVST
jgi:hypothetical protein